MKKTLTTLSLFLVILICMGSVVFVSCDDNDSNSYSPSSNSGSSLTVSDKEEIAENEALSAIYSKIKSSSYSYKYDASQTTYKIGSINYKYGKYEVNGRLTFYDKYGDIVGTGTFSVDVKVNDDGTASCTVYSDDIDYDFF